LHARQPGLLRLVWHSVPNFPKNTSRTGSGTHGRLRLFLFHPVARASVGFYHVFGPSPAAGGDPIDSEPATITNFNGFVGLAYVSGNVTQTNTETGEDNLFPFVDSDMRFMSGTFVGKEHQAAFALV
jgi:hypothetical protein